MNKLNKLLLRWIIKRELKKQDQVTAISEMYYTLTSFMLKNFKDYDGKKNYYFPHLSDTRRQDFDSFVVQCHIDCVNRIKTSGPDREI